MKTTKRFALLLMALFSFGIASAQADADEMPEGDKANREKIKSMKIAYITEKLNLTSEEAVVFWPVYNEYSEKKMNLRKENREKHKAAKAKTKLSNKEMEELVDGELEFKVKMLELDKEFHAKVKTLLPIEKVMLLYRAEHGFKREMMHKMKKPQKGKAATPAVK